MNNLSEEEIIEEINDLIEFCKEELKAEHSIFTEEQYLAIQGLLDLYNKEKEKNEELEKGKEWDGHTEKDVTRLFSLISNSISEEEIIKNANEIIYNAECWIDDEEYTGKEEREWAEFEKKTIQGLLELYNKEKNKNKELKENLIFRVNYCKKLEQELYGGDFELTIPEQKEFINKDKIRELKQKIHKSLDSNGIARAYQLEIDKCFDELLEE